jgi:hypothetical protein
MPTVSYKVPELILEDFPHGDTLDLFFDEVTDEDTGDPIDLTAGYAAEQRFEEKDGTEVVTLNDTDGITLGNGNLRITSETNTWPQNCTIYSDLQFTAPGGNTETWIKIIVKLRKTITTPT